MSLTSQVVPLRSNSALEGEWDAVVIGAGPAGALVARQLASAGKRVLLVEKKRFPRPKVCGACINARAISVLESAGLSELITRLAGVPLQQLEIVAHGRRVQLPLTGAYSIGREEFDAALVNEAVTAGVSFLDGATAKVGELIERNQWRQVTISSGAAVRVNVLAQVVLAADGLQHSSLGEQHEFPSEVSTDSLIGLGATISADDSDLAAGSVRMVVGRFGYVGLVRIAHERLNVAAALQPQHLRESPGAGECVAELLRAAGIAVPSSIESAVWHGTVALSRQTRHIADCRLFLVGDATGYVEPFTGEGIAWALASAMLVAPLAVRCIEGTLSPEQSASAWQNIHAIEICRRQRWCRRLARVLRSEWLSKLALLTVQYAPSLVQILMRQLNESFSGRSPPADNHSSVAAMPRSRVH